MNTGISEFIQFGLISLVCAIAILLGIVRELRPAIQGNWLLGVALGSGIIALAIKIVLVVVVSQYSFQINKFFATEKKVAQTYVKPQQKKIAQVYKTAYKWESLPQTAPIPENNPMSDEKIKLGKLLFFDKRLSADNSLACVSCHDLSEEKGGADGLAVSIGIAGQKGNRNAPSVINAAFQKVLFWDGRAKSLEEQAKGPLLNPVEMGMPSFTKIEEKIANIPQYQQLFSLVFPKQPSITIDNVTKAIAAYERILVSNNSAYDRFVQGDNTALSSAQIQGMALFESKGCVICHSGPNFSAASVYDGGGEYRMFPAMIPSIYEAKYKLSDDLGLNAGSAESKRGVWRVPSLRNVSRTAPYFHNGSVNTLEEAVRIMANVQLGKKVSNVVADAQQVNWLAENRQFNITRDNAINDSEVNYIVAFLKALNSDITM